VKPERAADTGDLLQQPKPAAAQVHLDSEDRLFGAFVGLAVVILLTPLRTVYLTPQMIRVMPLVVYHDLGVAMALAWLFHLLFRLTSRPSVHKLLAFAGWTLCLLLALYSCVSVVVYYVIRRPLTLGLLVAGSDLRGIRASIVAVATRPIIGFLAYAPCILVIVALALSRMAPRALQRMRRRFHSLAGLAVEVAYLVAASAWSAFYLPSIPVSFTNPDWTLASSIFDRGTMLVTDQIPPGYLDDFQPVGKRPAPSTQIARPPASRVPLNILMVVMESVGQRQLELYGSHFDDSPRMIQLSNHAAFFTHTNAAEANTSSAMAALFSSVYPNHDWPTITHIAPALAIPGLPAVLASHGYRTAFIHSGQLAYDHQGEFLRTRGFSQIISEVRDYDSPRDDRLLPETIQWIKADPSKPFFVAIWTQDTHHPYLNTLNHDYGATAPRLNQYLNAVRATDTLIGQLAEALQTMGLADRTLLVITGDHGEAFGEHGVLIHGSNVYDEETRVPLLIVNPTLFPRKLVVNRVARQIDIAPTLLGLLGIEVPPDWQGSDLFADDRPLRSYIFSGEGTPSFGLVDGDFKYVFDVNNQREELYNLATDPGEQHDLSHDPAYAEMIQRDHLRIEAWVSFQNSYIDRFAKSAPPAAH
jgi:lipoteichoic acid synthase